jgi:hypothetical protein
LNCRVESISSPSKQAPRIFQTSPEHPNARIIITPPYASKTRPVSASGDIFDPQLPSKARRSANSNSLGDDHVRRTSSRKRTVTGKYDDGSSETDSLSEEFVSSRNRRPSKVRRVSESKEAATVTPASERRRKSSSKLLESAESTPRKRESTSRPASSSKSIREKEARLDRRENEELYEALQKQVTIDLLKRRYVCLHT